MLHCLDIVAILALTLPRVDELLLLSLPDGRLEDLLRFDRAGQTDAGEGALTMFRGVSKGVWPVQQSESAPRDYRLLPRLGLEDSGPGVRHS